MTMPDTPTPADWMKTAAEEIAILLEKDFKLAVSPEKLEKGKYLCDAGRLHRIEMISAIMANHAEGGGKCLNVSLLMGVPRNWTAPWLPSGQAEFQRWETASCRLLRRLLIGFCMGD